MTASTKAKTRPANREAWLQQAVTALRPHFRKAGVALPAVRVSCGWPGGRTRPAAGKTITGQCWTSAKDGRAQLFISPTIDSGHDALAILVHELCHAADANTHGHAKEFADLAYSVGLVGKATETTAGGELAMKLATIATRLGKYPHSALLPDSGDGKKKQTTRMVKVWCPECGYTLRTTRQWISAGLPSCPCDTLMVTEPEPESDDDE